MSRIVALFHRNGRPADPAILQRLIAPLRHSATDGPRFWMGSSAGLAYQCLQSSSGPDERQPTACTRELAICFDGRLDNREELAGELSSELPAKAAELSDSALVLACYRRFGDSFATHLNGDYAVALYDGERQQLLLARDVMGIRPLYFWQSCDTVVGSSELKAILAHPEIEARPDDMGLADVLVGGDPNELRLTCFRDVRRVLPGHTVIFDRGPMRDFRYWDFDPSRQMRCASLAEYAETLRALFEQAVRRRLRSPRPVGVFVSGGLDSSAILCQAETLRQAGAPVAKPVGVSMVFPDGTAADEKQYLEDIQAQYNVEIRKLPISSFRYMDEKEWLWQTEFPRLRWDSDLACLKAARDLGCSAVLDGDYGDQMMSTSGHLYDLARSFRWLKLLRSFRALAASMTDSSPRLLGQELLHAFLRDLVPDRLMRPARSIRRLWDSDRSPRWYTKRFRDLAYRRSQQQRRPAQRFAGKHAELCYSYFLAAHRLNPIEEVNKLAAVYGMEKAYPFMDRDLVEFVMAIPGEVVNWEGKFKGLFREAMSGILPDPIRRRYWKTNITQLDTDAAATLYPTYQEYLRTECLAVKFGYFDPVAFPGAFSRQKARLTGQQMLPAAQVNAAVALELWLQAFFAKP